MPLDAAPTCHWSCVLNTRYGCCTYNLLVATQHLAACGAFVRARCLACTHSRCHASYSTSGNRACITPCCTVQQASQEDLYRGRPSEALQEVVLEVATVARAHLQEARSLAPKLPKGASQVLLPAVGAGMYLQALEKADFNVFDQRLQTGGGALAPLWYTLLVKWHLMRGTY